MRCAWAGADPLYLRYHDAEWGRPVADDRRLFEKICLEGFQSGLSWLTILRKRQNFRRAFHGFDFQKVARFERPDVTRLLSDAGIVRHRGKIESTVNNARRTRDVVREFSSLASYVWHWEPSAAWRPKRMTLAALRRMTQSAESLSLSRDLKRRGFTFVGPTTIYAFMQAVGLVNDHLEGCAFREEVEKKRKRFARPA